MAANAFVRARIDEDLKNEAALVLADLGLTVSDVVRIVLTRVARERALPFDLKAPNRLTAKTLRKSDKGGDLHRAKDAKDLFRKIGV